MTKNAQPLPFALPARGAALLEIIQDILIVGLAVFGSVRAVSDGAGTMSFLGVLLLLVSLGIGRIQQRRERSGRKVTPVRKVEWALIVLVLGAALVICSYHFVWLQFPLWLLAAQALPLVWALPATATSLTVVISVLLQTNSSTASVIGPMIGALVAVGIARGALLLQNEAQRSQELLDRVLATQSEAAALSDEVVRMQREAGKLEERTRLARDIHDTLAQGFSSIILLARVAERTSDPAAVHNLVTQIETTASDNLTQARQVVYALNPPDIASGLSAPLQRLGNDLANQTTAEVTVEVDPNLRRLPIADEIILLRAAQGTLANIRRHAHASHVSINVSVVDGTVRLDIVDDGVGFDPAALPAIPTFDGGYGLGALKARLSEAGGGLAIESELGSGTALSVWLPLRNEP
ncbi:sensor histidine kinase [Arcanobacterium bovis]|uniref:Oxygen sensor histidine kinase NreB n=1 Tax=Arcanobacterium bovis TaxID=2529275 RepID=A0A4Q9V1P0_9ACTO|nr:sensor histidine kinase [Arcanobacterium bovis]TBW22985.1 sensor histidine kinase [Arcanobacterium bovis]